MQKNYILLLIAIFCLSFLIHSSNAQTCQDGVTCCSDPSWTSTDDDGARLCDIMITEDSITKRPGDDVTIRCNPGFESYNGFGDCTWELPNGDECTFDRGAPQGFVCVSDETVEWVGHLADGSCDIEIVQLKENDHDGKWTCSMTTDRTLRDYIYIEVIHEHSAGQKSCPVYISSIVSVVIAYIMTLI